MGNKIAGGHFNCIWNPTTIGQADYQIWDGGRSPTDVVVYLSEEMKELAGRAANPCPGCIMPRLTFDMVSTELGMAKALVPNYLRLRKETAGF
jgi:hypothetical protein